VATLVQPTGRQVAQIQTQHHRGIHTYSFN
jgi:hypothetical protein